MLEGKRTTRLSIALLASGTRSRSRVPDGEVSEISNGRIDSAKHQNIV